MSDGWRRGPLWRGRRSGPHSSGPQRAALRSGERVSEPGALQRPAVPGPVRLALSSFMKGPEAIQRDARWRSIDAEVLVEIDAVAREVGCRALDGDVPGVQDHDVVSDVEDQLGVLLDQDD